MAARLVYVTSGIACHPGNAGANAKGETTMLANIIDDALGVLCLGFWMWIVTMGLLIVGLCRLFKKKRPDKNDIVRVRPKR
jgi:hypothetical protein